MSVGKHRVAALAILATGTLGVFAWGRSMDVDPPEVQAVRDRLDGAWVATRVQADANGAGGTATAAPARVEFAGRAVVFRGLVEGMDGRGTYYIEPDKSPDWIDMKLDAGWIVGLFHLDGDRLTLCLNPLAQPERLGVPNRPRARAIGPATGRNYYVFRRAKP